MVQERKNGLHNSGSTFYTNLVACYRCLLLFQQKNNMMQQSVLIACLCKCQIMEIVISFYSNSSMLQEATKMSLEKKKRKDPSIDFLSLSLSKLSKR